MKEHIDTIPVTDAFSQQDECPFCYLERQAEQRAIRYIAGPESSYMEPDVRAMTDKLGFCRQHYKALYDYGNSLGNALMMQTYYVGLQKELKLQMGSFELPAKKGLFSKKLESLPILGWIKEKESTCFLCGRLQYNMRRYYATFFHLLKEPEFRQSVENSKGFCFHHFGALLEIAEEFLSNNQISWFYPTVLALMENNLARVQADIDWFIDKFDYRNASTDWKNSKDAVPRGMQKLKGGYPSDRPFKGD